MSKPTLAHMPTASAKPRHSPRAARARARQIGFCLFAVMMTLIVLVVVWLMP